MFVPFFIASPAEVTQASLVWFCSSRTSSQWLDHWTRQRLKWWRKVSVCWFPANVGKWGLTSEDNSVVLRLTPSTLKSFQFALSPSDFSSSGVAEEELEEPASHGVRILYRFPWGQEPLETLWMRGNSELLQMHKGVRSKLQVSLLLCFFCPNSGGFIQMYWSLYGESQVEDCVRTCENIPVLAVWLCCHVFKLPLLCKTDRFYNDRLLSEVRFPIFHLI